MTNDPVDPYDLANDLVEQNKRAKERRERKQARDNGNADHALQGDVLPPELHGFELTEDGVAQAFALERGRDLRYCYGPNRWHRWDGTRWKPEQTKLAYHWVRELARRMARSTSNTKIHETLGKQRLPAVWSASRNPIALLLSRPTYGIAIPGCLAHLGEPSISEPENCIRRHVKITSPSRPW